MPGASIVAGLTGLSLFAARWARRILLMVALAPLLCAQSGGGSISGRVMNSVTGAGVGDVKVRACTTCTNADASHQAVTDYAGAYRLR
jgi:hypothetical protein